MFFLMLESYEILLACVRELKFCSIAFVAFDPRTGTWHRAEREIDLQVLKHMVPGKRT